MEALGRIGSLWLKLCNLRFRALVVAMVCCDDCVAVSGFGTCVTCVSCSLVRCACTRSQQTRDSCPCAQQWPHLFQLHPFTELTCVARRRRRRCERLLVVAVVVVVVVVFFGALILSRQTGRLTCATRTQLHTRTWFVRDAMAAAARRRHRHLCELRPRPACACSRVCNWT